MPEKHSEFHSINGKRSILIIEDELINREILGYMLQDTYEVLYAEDGARALRILDEQCETLSLVLLDLNLPDMKGLDILQKMKEDRRTALLPVIVLTADQDAEVECLSVGATDFISKPYPKQEIVLARIRRTIELFEDRDLIRWTERDALTGLYNPDFFFRHAAQFDTFHPDTPMDAIVLDINHFHMLNERFGRETGDEVLKLVAGKLLEAVEASGGIVCRRNGDTFLIYCPHRSDYADILKSVCVEMSTDNHIRARMGVYSEVSRSVDIERRFDRAKQAADAVRDNYALAVGIYDNSMHEKELYMEQLLEDFDTAIRENQFTVHYQPKFDIRGPEPVLSSAEALVRWQHPKFGMVSPGVFIPFFEGNGLIRKLDSYVWREAARQVREWKDKLGMSIPVSVNVSRIDLNDPSFQKNMEGIVEGAGIERGEFLLEITESAYTDNSAQIADIVKALRESGFFIEMDDFGTGYSSLNMITDLPLDALKLDMQFVRSAFRGRKDTRHIEAVIGLAKALSLPVIAEGVETAEQMFTLKAMGCDIVQGYYFSKPLPADEFEAYVRKLDRESESGAAQAPRLEKNRPRDQFTYDAMHDPLTGLYNHSAFDILFHDADQDHIAVLIATVDGYKALRESKGKACADRVIQRVANVLRGTFRSADHVCRLQEDEFVIILTRITSAMQKQVLGKIDRINQALADAPEGKDPVSLSVGVAFSDQSDSGGDVFEDADIALRRMKQMRRTDYAV